MERCALIFMVNAEPRFHDSGSVGEVTIRSVDNRCCARIPFGMTRHAEMLPMTTDTTALQRDGIPDIGLGIGDTFPDVVLPAVSDGQPMSLAAFRGEKLFLHLFASW